MLLRLTLFFLVTTTIWALAHLYVDRRLLGRWDLAPRRRRRARLALWGLFALAPLVMSLGRVFVAEPWLAPLQWIAFTHMGLFFLLFSLVLVGDLAASVAKLAFRWRRVEPMDPERRRFLHHATSAGMVGASGVLGAWGLVEAVAEPELVEVDIPVPNLPPDLDGYRIVQLSDIHIGPTIRGEFLARVAARVNALEPDLVAVTGDLVDGLVPSLGPEVAPLGALRGKDGVYFCTGNHEYYWDAEAWCEEVARLGLTVLNNAHRLVERGGARLLVAGCTDHTAHQILEAHRSDPAKAKEGAPPHDFSILLAHNPRSIDAGAAAGFDLQLSGHTHGGQFFPVSLFVGFVHPFSEGLGKRERTWIYVNRGTGYWGPPNRAGVPSEISLLRLVRA
ncbi:MAG: metallophosphoesterase [Myxococcales bacterium]|nr:metallophosphoesterase [Myxococcales bacterium]